jgi:uncharacterized protein YecE (DUF72 family)
MAEIMIGTCGYGYTDWVGPVYPKGTKPDARLGLYSGMFTTVEIDNTYYGMPTAANLAQKLTDGGPDLTFAIKAYKALTHEIKAGEWEEIAKNYLKAIEPLREAGRLEAVLFQFPYSFHYTDDNRRYLDKLLTYFEDTPKAVEFRTADWITGRVIEG